MSVFSDEYHEVHLRDYWYVLSKRRTAFFLFLIFCLCTALFFTFREKVLFKPSSTILIERQNPNVVDFKEVMAVDTAQTEYYQTQHQIIKSRSLVGQLIKKLNLDQDPYLQELHAGKFNRFLKKQDFLPSWAKDFWGSPYLEDTFTKKILRVNPIRNSRLVEISVLHPSSIRAAEIVNELVELFIQRNLEERFLIASKAAELISGELTQLKTKVADSQRKLQVYKEEQGLVSIPSIREKNDFLEQARLELVKIQAEESKLKKRYLPAHPKMIHIRSQIEGLQEKMESEENRIVSLSRTAIDYDELEREAKSSSRIYEALLKRLQETSSEAQTQASNIIVVDKAEPPLKPFTPRPILNLSIAFFFGVIGGVLFAFFLEYVDPTVKVPEDIERGTGLELLGVVPQAEKSKNKKIGGDLFFSGDEPSAASEAIRALRTALIVKLRHVRTCKIILITSPNPKEGKTTITANLAAAFSQNHLKVLLIDADLRKSRVHQVLGISLEKGLSDVLEGSATLEEAIQSSPAGVGFDFLSGGTYSNHPTEILGSEKMKEILTALKNKYDIILIDSPPYLAVADVIVLSELANAILVMSRYHTTDRRHLKRVKQRFAESPASLIGAVINLVSAREKNYYYQQYYYYGYGEEPKKK